MLDNLPAYTVKNVKVYDKAGKLSQLTGHDMGDKQYKMDVNLKKQYQIGWLGNIEGGSGTKDRYLARLFAMRFTPHSRITLYGNLNNLNDNRKPGENTEWTMDKMPKGLLTTRTAGADYLINDRQARFKFNGNIQFSHSDTDNRAYTSTENYLAAGSSYKRTANQQKGHDITVSTSNEWELHFGEHNTMLLQPTLSYTNYRNTGLNTEASLIRDLGDMNISAFLDSISRPTLSSALQQLVSNRVMRSSLGRGHSFSSNLAIKNFMKVPGLFDAIQSGGSIHYNRSSADNFDNRSTDYPSANSTTPPDFRRRWDRNRPTHDWGYSAFANYSYIIGKSAYIAAGYTIEQSFSKDFKDIFRLDSLSDWGYSADHPLGSHPTDAALLLSVLDKWNSYHLRQNNLQQTPFIENQWSRITKDNLFFQVLTTVNFPIQTNRLHYRRATFDGLEKRNAFFVNPKVEITQMWDNNRKGAKFTYEFSSSMPNLIDLIELDNTLDPLNITTGNAHLRNAHTHAASFYYSFNNTPKQRTFSIYLTANLTDGTTGQSYLYYPTLGAYYFRPVNLNGVKLISANIYYQSPFRQAHTATDGTPRPSFWDTFSFSTRTYAQFHSRPEKTGTINSDNAYIAAPINWDEAIVRSTYTAYWVTEDLRLKYDRGILTTELNGYLAWNRGRNSHSHVSTGNILDFHYGLDLQLRLPWKISLSTDFKVYSRRGYSISSLNDDNLVWNMRLQKAFTPRLTLSVDAFDILGRLDNVTQVLTSGYHSETRFNSIPRYVMARLIYRFHIAPKKKAH